MEKNRNAIFGRTSVRNYESVQVEDEKIEMLLKAGMASPSAGNQQPWEFYVVTSKEKLQELANSSPYAGCTANAPFAIVNCYRKETMMPDYAQIDMSACTENILLEAEELGLGAVWLGVAPIEERMEAVRRILSIPETLEAFAIIPCGYPVLQTSQQDRFNKDRIHYVK